MSKHIVKIVSFAAIAVLAFGIAGCPKKETAKSDSAANTGAPAAKDAAKKKGDKPLVEEKYGFSSEAVNAGGG